MFYTRTVMTTYKKASPETVVEVAHGHILPVDGFGTLEVDLAQPGNTTKLVRMGAIVYVLGFSRNLLSTFKAVDKWKNTPIYYRIKAVLGFPGKEARSKYGGGWASENRCAGVALAVAAKARNIMKVYYMLAHPSEGITQKTTEAMRITTTGQWGSCEACLQAQAKRDALPKMMSERASVKEQ